MNIADDLVRAFNDGYEKGKEDAEAYLLHCGDTDEPQTNADRIRAMTDEELAEWLSCPGRKKDMFPDLEIYIAPSADEWLDWLKQEAVSNG